LLERALQPRDTGLGLRERGVSLISVKPLGKLNMSLDCRQRSAQFVCGIAGETLFAGERLAGSDEQLVERIDRRSELFRRIVDFDWYECIRRSSGQFATQTLERAESASYTEPEHYQAAEQCYGKRHSCDRDHVALEGATLDESVSGRDMHAVLNVGEQAPAFAVDIAVGETGCRRLTPALLGTERTGSPVFCQAESGNWATRPATIRAEAARRWSNVSRT